MGWGPVLKAIVGQQRAASFADSPQLTLGQLIERLEAIPPEWEKGRDENDRQKLVRYDFAWLFPTTLHSWRGAYDEVSLGWAASGHAPNGPKPPTVTELIERLREGIGGCYEGWKGGTFCMDGHTPIWCDNEGDGGNTAIVGVIDLGYAVVIQTAYCEY